MGRKGDAGRLEVRIKQWDETMRFCAHGYGVPIRHFLGMLAKLRVLPKMARPASAECE
jgi:hypothetical protein